MHNNTIIFIHYDEIQADHEVLEKSGNSDKETINGGSNGIVGNVRSNGGSSDINGNNISPNSANQLQMAGKFLLSFFSSSSSSLLLLCFSYAFLILFLCFSYASYAYMLLALCLHFIIIAKSAKTCLYKLKVINIRSSQLVLIY